MRQIFSTIKLLFALLLCPLLSWTQCNNLQVTAPATACKNGLFEMTTSTLAASYEWDFCIGDLTNAPSPSSLFQMSLNRPFDVEVVSDQGEWYGFVLGYQSNSISRVDYGLNLRNTSPTELDLGNPGNFLNNPTSIKVIKQGANWFALIYSQGNRSVILLSFGSSIENNSPSAFTVASAIGGIEGAIDVAQVNPTSFIAKVTDSDGGVTTIPFPNGLDQPIGSISNINIGGYLTDVQIVNDCNSWSVFVLRLDTKNVIRLDYGNDLFSVPTVIPYPSNQFSFNPYRLWIGKEGNYLFGLVSNLTGGIASLDIGLTGNVSSPIVTEHGNLGGVLNSSWSIFAVKESLRWSAFTLDGNTSDLFRLDFPISVCDANIQTSVSQNPGFVSYASSGNKNPVLKAVYANGITESKTIPILIQNLVAPPIQINPGTNLCVSSPFTFFAQSSSTLTQTNWDFGDGTNSSSPTPSHLFASGGQYLITLKGTDVAGCSNIASNSLKVYNPPISDFNVPSSIIRCTNQQFTFINTTSSDIGSLPAWQWEVNGANVSTSKDLIQSFTTVATQTIKLTATIPGCSSQIFKNFTTTSVGPLANFTLSAITCQSSSISFTNTTSGSTTSYLWTFGDGNTASSTNASNTYSNIGPYNVTLQANNASGCQNTATKTITIYSKPQPDFSIGLPPFSCERSSSQFTDLTPTPTDSNITGWQWAFGDVANGTSTSKNPSYIYATAGNYNVSLTATSNFGCSGSVQKLVTISPSPTASFTNSVACINQSAEFTDTSTGSIRSRLWQVQGNSFSTPTVNYNFSSSGSFPVVLTITGNNNCVNQLSKNISVPVQPSLDFSVQAPCVNNPSTFTEITSGADAPLSQVWNFGSQSATGPTAQFSFSSAGTYPVQLRSTRQSGCVYAVTKNISITQGPVADFVPSVEAGAPPLSVSFANNSTGATSYLWKFKDANNTTSLLQSPNFVFNDLGNYPVELTAFNSLGCTAMVSKDINVLIPSINVVLSDFYLVADVSGTLQPMLSILNKSNLSITNPDVLLEVESNGLIKKKLVGKILPDQTLTLPIDLQIVPRNASFICAEVDIPNNVADFDKRRCIPLSTNEVLFAPYPNPAKAEMNLDWISVDATAVKVVIVNSTGAIVYQQSFTSIAAGLNRLQIDTSSLPNGLYFITFSSDKTTQSFRFATANN